jgi:hypothetical protein
MMTRDKKMSDSCVDFLSDIINEDNYLDTKSEANGLSDLFLGVDNPSKARAQREIMIKQK